MKLRSISWPRELDSAQVRLSVGTSIIACLILLAVLAPFLSPYDPEETNPNERIQPPSLTHVFGTDHFGRDILSRVIFGSRISLVVGIISVGIALFTGIFLGSIAGYYRGKMDETIMRTMDALFAFPAILLAIALVAVLGPSITNAMMAIGVVYTPYFVRLVRGVVLSVRENDFIRAARALGESNIYIIFREVLPNCVAPILVQTTTFLAYAILMEAALSFLGLGTQPPTPSWGRMLSEARGFTEDAPWIAIFPGAAIMIAVLGFNSLGDGLRDILDPRYLGTGLSRLASIIPSLKSFLERSTLRRIGSSDEKLVREAVHQGQNLSKRRKPVVHSNAR